MVRPGISHRDVASLASEAVRHHAPDPRVHGVARLLPTPDVPFPSSAAVNVNEDLTHAVPTDRRLVAGDVVTIDVAIRVEPTDGPMQWLDAARCVVVEDRHARAEADGRGTGQAGRARALVEAAHAVTTAGVGAVGSGVRFGAVRRAMLEAARVRGVDLWTGVGGHGVGERVHETPHLWMDGSADEVELSPGMIVTIEPLVMERREVPLRRTVTGGDGWTTRAGDGRWGAFVEQTVLVGPRGPEILTAGGSGTPPGRGL